MLKLNNILIDSYNNLDYLSTLGTNHIDYIFISHFDNDHSSTLYDVINDYKVKKIFYSNFSCNDSFKVDERWVCLESNQVLLIDNIKIEVFGPIRNYLTANLNSLVLKVYINDYSFLFTGDINAEVENDLILTFGNKLKSDVLKVAHHGSKTSSSKDFLECVRPKYSVISVSNFNYYGLPNQEVVDRLNKYSKLYLTKKSGNITFRIYENSMKMTHFK